MTPYEYKDIVDCEDEPTLKMGKLYPYEHIDRFDRQTKADTIRPPASAPSQSGIRPASGLPFIERMYIALGGDPHRRKL